MSQTDYNAAMSRANLGESTLTPATVGKIGYLRTLTSQPDPIEAGCSENAGYVAPDLVGGDIFRASQRKAGEIPGIGRIQAFSAATGKPLWSVPTTPGFGPMSSMVVADGLVIGSASSAGGGTVVRGQSHDRGAAKYTLTGATNVLAVDASLVFADCSNFDVCGYDLGDGSQEWQVSDNSQLAAEAGGVLYLADGQALNASTGAQLGFIWEGGARLRAALVEELRQFPTKHRELRAVSAVTCPYGGE